MTNSPDELITALDEDQRVVVEALAGPVCVLAGAGTGKTRAITHRIAYGVATGSFDPKRTMALTFTTRAAAELRNRLRELGAGEVQARTFHAAALAQLNHFWPIVVGGPAPRVLEYKGRILGQAAEEIKLKVDPAVLRDVAAEIEWRKVSGLSMARYESLLGARGTPGRLSSEQLIELINEYERNKDARRAIDFEDVLLVTAGMVESEPSVALQVRESYRHFVIDEYQDVSPAQQTLLDLWVGNRNDICVVGDASQTIYSFAGASAEFLLNFERRYPKATVVRLERNYRSTSAIVDMANRLMRGQPGALKLAVAPGPVRVVSARTAAPKITVYNDDAEEAQGVATAIRHSIDEGHNPASIAILTRVNSQTALLERALAEVNISSRIRGAARFFDQPEVRQAIHALRGAAIVPTSDPLFKSVSDVLRSLGWSVQPPTAPGAIRSRWESLDAIAALVDEQPEGTTLRKFADDLLGRANENHEPDLAAVNIATLHSAKGLEWDEVYLVGLAEGLLPISYAKNMEAVAEERRLLYVGITRAKQRIFLSWARRSGLQRGERVASRFLQDLGSRNPGAVRIAR